MSLDRFLQFFVGDHNVMVINLLFVVVMVGVFAYAVHSFYYATKEKEDTDTQVKEIESALKRVLQSTEVKATTTAAPGNAEAAEVKASEDFAALQKLFEDREKKVKELEAKLAGQPAGASGTPADAGAAPAAAAGATEAIKGMEVKVKDLEAKLQEYEIIEDDIANLSLYKEENARLKNELEKLKSGGVADVTPSPTPATASAEVTPPVTTDPVSAPTSVAEVPPPDDDLMAEFAAAVAAQKEAEDAPVVAAPEVTPAASAPATPAAAPAEEDDIMAQFAAAVDQAPEPEATPAAPASTTDESKIQELAAVAAQPSVAAADSEHPLAASTDTDKMLSEMESLLNAKAPEEDDKDPTEKLISEFENISKGS